jgi:sirohydrochlorin ferrochelatase
MSARAALVLLDHGSRRAQADRHLLALAEAVRRRRPELAVWHAHLELASPSLAEVLAQCEARGCERVSVYPLFLSAGRHLERDLPEQIERGARAHPRLQIELLEALGSRPELAELVLAGYEAGAAAAGRRPRCPGAAE